MTPEEMIAEQSKRHHEAMNQITRVLSQVQQDGKRTYELLAGTYERPGLVHRMAAMESWRADSPKRWMLERGTKLVDALIVAGVLTIIALGIRAFIFQAVQSGVAFHYQRDRVALNEER